MRQDERSGLLFALAGFIILSLGDGVIKTMAGEWPATAVAALRYSIGAAGLAIILAIREGRAGFRFPHPVAQLMRGVGMGIATLSFFTAAFLMPLATATAIGFTAPMITAILSRFILGEPAPRATWLASFAAFSGVLIMLRPSFAEIGWPALLPLLASLGFSISIIGNRMVAGRGTALSMQVIVAGIAAIFLVVASLAGAASGVPQLTIGVPDWTIVARCAAVAVTASSAHWLVYLATTRAGAATIVPMTYVQLLVATALGIVFFHDRPDAMSMLGAAIIIGAGLYLWREGGQQRRANMAANS
ncbi:DMT family transporter [Altererythrobacter aquiaggeris]|uniref:DMT family transporter n=1 Tax=Aestuarierythrobacter aquiaggeris TaxID=1898396 RepID=UPI0030174290